MPVAMPAAYQSTSSSRPCAALAGDAEAGEQERTGEALESVDGAAVPARGPGQGDPGVAGRGEGPDRSSDRQVGQRGPACRDRAARPPVVAVGGRGRRAVVQPVC